jgi:hypothetical protein
MLRVLTWASEIPQLFAALTYSRGAASGQALANLQVILCWRMLMPVFETTEASSAIGVCSAVITYSIAIASRRAETAICPVLAIAVGSGLNRLMWPVVGPARNAP